MSVQIDFEARDAQLRATLANIERSMERVAKNTNNLRFDKGLNDTVKLNTSIKAVDASIQKMNADANQTVSRLKSMAVAAAAFATSILGLSKFSAASDYVTNLDNRLSLVVGRGAGLRKARHEMIELSKMTAATVQSTTELYSRIGQSTAGKLTRDDLRKTTEAIQYAVKIGGGSAASIDAALMQLGQAFSSDFKNAAAEMNSLADQAPMVLKAIYEGLGMTRGEFKEAMADGKISTDMVTAALLKQRELLKSMSANIIPSISVSFGRMSEAVFMFFGELNKGLGFGAALSSRFIRIADYFYKVSESIAVDTANVVNDLKILALAFLGPIFSSIASKIEVVFGKVKELYSSFSDYLKSSAVFNSFTTAVKNIVTGAIPFIVDSFNSMVSAVSLVIDKLISVFNRLKQVNLTDLIGGSDSKVLSTTNKLMNQLTDPQQMQALLVSASLVFGIYKAVKLLTGGSIISGILLLSASFAGFVNLLRSVDMINAIQGNRLFGGGGENDVKGGAGSDTLSGDSYYEKSVKRRGQVPNPAVVDWVKQFDAPKVGSIDAVLKELTRTVNDKNLGMGLLNLGAALLGVWRVFYLFKEGRQISAVITAGLFGASVLAQTDLYAQSLRVIYERLSKIGKVVKELFTGDTTNTASLLEVTNASIREQAGKMQSPEDLIAEQTAGLEQMLKDVNALTPEGAKSIDDILKEIFPVSGGQGGPKAFFESYMDNIKYYMDKIRDYIASFDIVSGFKDMLSSISDFFAFDMNQAFFLSAVALASTFSGTLRGALFAAFKKTSFVFLFALFNIDAFRQVAANFASGATSFLWQLLVGDVRTVSAKGMNEMVSDLYIKAEGENEKWITKVSRGIGNLLSALGVAVGSVVIPSLFDGTEAELKPTIEKWATRIGAAAGIAIIFAMNANLRSRITGLLKFLAGFGDNALQVALTDAGLGKGAFFGRMFRNVGFLASGYMLGGMVSKFMEFGDGTFLDIATRVGVGIGTSLASDAIYSMSAGLGRGGRIIQGGLIAMMAGIALGGVVNDNLVTPWLEANFNRKLTSEESNFALLGSSIAAGLGSAVTMALGQSAVGALPGLFKRAPKVVAPPVTFERVRGAPQQSAHMAEWFNSPAYKAQTAAALATAVDPKAVRVAMIRRLAVRGVFAGLGTLVANQMIDGFNGNLSDVQKAGIYIGAMAGSQFFVPMMDRMLTRTPSFSKLFAGFFKRMFKGIGGRALLGGAIAGGAFLLADMFAPTLMKDLGDALGKSLGLANPISPFVLFMVGSGLASAASALVPVLTRGGIGLGQLMLSKAIMPAIRFLSMPGPSLAIGAVITELFSVAMTGSGIIENLVGPTDKLMGQIADGLLIGATFAIAAVTLGLGAAVGAAVLAIVTGLWVALRQYGFVDQASVDAFVKMVWDGIIAGFERATAAAKAVWDFALGIPDMKQADWVNLGTNIITGIFEGMKSLGDTIQSWFTELFTTDLSDVQQAFINAKALDQKAANSYALGNGSDAALWRGQADLLKANAIKSLVSEFNVTDIRANKVPATARKGVAALGDPFAKQFDYEVAQRKFDELKSRQHAVKYQDPNLMNPKDKQLRTDELRFLSTQISLAATELIKAKSAYDSVKPVNPYADSKSDGSKIVDKASVAVQDYLMNTSSGIKSAIDQTFNDLRAAKDMNDRGYGQLGAQMADRASADLIAELKALASNVDPVTGRAPTEISSIVASLPDFARVIFDLQVATNRMAAASEAASNAQLRAGSGTIGQFSMGDGAVMHAENALAITQASMTAASMNLDAANVAMKELTVQSGVTNVPGSINATGPIISANLDAVLSKVSGMIGPSQPATLPPAVHKAAGGFVSGAGTGTSDSIPAMLSNGEFVVNAKATKKFGGLLHSINSRGIAKFRDGGVAGDMIIRGSASAGTGGYPSAEVTNGGLYNDINQWVYTMTSGVLGKNMKIAAGAINEAANAAKDNAAATNGSTGATNANTKELTYAEWITKRTADKAKALTEALRELPLQLAELSQMTPAYFLQAGIDGAQATSDSMKSHLSALLKGEESPLEALGGFFDDLTGSIIDHFVDSFTNALFNSLDLNGLLGGLFGGVSEAGASVGGGVGVKLGGSSDANGLDPMSTLADQKSGLSAWITDFFGSMESTLSSLFSGDGGFLSGLSSLVSSLFSGISSLFGGLFGGFGGGSIPALATGGRISGPGTGTSDSILAQVSNGEFIMNAESTKRWLPLLQHMNDGGQKLPAFAMGGRVGGEPPKAIFGSTGKTSTQTVVHLNVTGDVSQQTRKEIVKLLPQITSGVNSTNRERGTR